MKHCKLFIGLILGLMPIISVHAVLDNEIPTSSKHSTEIGTGHDTDRESFVGKCLKGSNVLVGKEESNLTFDQSISQQALSKELGFGVGGRYRYGAIQASASAKFVKNTKENRHSISAIYSGNYSFFEHILGEVELTELGQSVINNPKRFREVCGNFYAYKQKRGAKIFFSIRIDFKTAESKKEFEAKFSLSGPLFSVSGNLKRAKNSFSKDTKVTVSALQIGGDVSKLSNIFKGDSGSLGQAKFISCSFGDLQACENVLKNALNYATNDETGFPSQISRDTDSSENNASATLSTFIQDYKYAIDVPHFTSELTVAIKAARRRINDLFDLVFDQYLTADSLIKTKIVRLGPEQNDEMKAASSILFESMYAIANGAQKCYREPLACEKINYMLNPLGDHPDRARLYKKEFFEVKISTLGQYCDRGISPYSTLDFQRSVKALVNYANFLNPTAFMPREELSDFDICTNVENILKKETTLNFSRDKLKEIHETGVKVLFENPTLSRGIVDLSMFYVLNRLEHLNLSGHEIESLESLTGPMSLRSINLSNNDIDDVSLLKKFEKLQRINLAGNILLADISPLAQMRRLRQLDLRNTGLNLDCSALSSRVNCLLGDYNFNNSFLYIETNHNIPRLGHTVTNLKGKGVLIAGGSTSTLIEIYDKDGEFNRYAELKAPRSDHSATAYKSGKVLYAGGWRALNTFEILSGNFTTLKKLINPRVEHKSILLDNGKVLLIGGWAGGYGYWTGTDALGSTELIDESGVTTVGPSLGLPRGGHTVTKLEDGRVVVIGGFTHQGGMASIEMFNPDTNKFTKIATRLKYGRGYHTATLMKNGRILISGGFSKKGKALESAEIFDPNSQRIADVRTKMNARRGSHQSVLLPSGKVLLVGGSTQFHPSLSSDDPCIDCLANAEVFDPNTQFFNLIQSEMIGGRSEFTMSEIGDNRLIILGGKGSNNQITGYLFEFSNL